MDSSNKDGVETDGNTREAITELYNRTFIRVYKTIRYRVNDDVVAEDLMAQVFEQALLSYDRYQPGLCPIDAWLFSIVRHVVGDYLRRARIFAWLPWESFLHRPGSDPAPEEVAIRHEMETQLALALPKLKDRERDLLGLKYGAGLTNRRIAELTGLSEQNVGVILYRALTRLRDLVGREQYRVSTPFEEVEHV